MGETTRSVIFGAFRRLLRFAFRSRISVGCVLVLLPIASIIMPTRIFQAFTLLILLSFGGIAPVGAQQDDSDIPPVPTPTSDSSVDVRLARIRDELTTSLSRLETLQRELAERQRDLEEATLNWSAAQESGNPQQIEIAQQAVEIAQGWVAGFNEYIEAEQQFYEQTSERFRIAQAQALLASSEDFQRSGQVGPESEFLETIQRRDRVTLAEQDAFLAKQRVEALRAGIAILTSRQETLRNSLDQINLVLDEGRSLNLEKRQEYARERQLLVDEERSLEDRMNDLRGQIVLAEISQRIKEEAAQQQLAEYRFWRRQLVVSLSFLLVIVAFLLLLRFLVARYVKDPDHRYTTNRRLSITMTLVLLIGLAIIFLRQFPSLFTGIGVVLAGVAIALQEVILSFFGFFAIRGARGYKIGDWVRIGDQYGEVIDVGLLVTILEEVTPIGFSNHRGGTKTGALTWINNNNIFREKMTNYTRGFPYIWCSLVYTITFESDWQRGEALLREIIEGHDEILTTAKLARKRVTEVATNFAIKVDNTAPRIRTWTADSGVELRVRFMAHPRRRRSLIDTINRQIMEAIAAAPDIDFAYNTLRVIKTPQEQPD